jgi:RING finger/CHY zinc finger protein 1
MTDTDTDTDTDTITDIVDNHYYEDDYDKDTLKCSDMIVEINFKKMINNKCSHYVPKCNIKVPCCKKSVRCIKCHEHTFSNSDIKYIVCDDCGCEQEISNKCLICDIKFAISFCRVCKIFTDNVNMYHCDDCNECVYLDHEGYVHCKKCKCCVERKYYKDHRCIDDICEKICNICLDAYTDTKYIVIARCGHPYHRECYKKIIENTYKCPICSKTIKDMTKEFNKLDVDIIRSGDKNSARVNIKCNDCENESYTSYNMIGLKCNNCLSYNTYKLF